MNEARSYRRLQDEGLDAGLDSRRLCGDYCRDEAFDLSGHPILDAIFGSMPSTNDQIEHIRREGRRNELLSMLNQAQDAITDGISASRIIVEIIEDELAGL